MMEHENLIKKEVGKYAKMKRIIIIAVSTIVIGTVIMIIFFNIPTHFTPHDWNEAKVVACSIGEMLREYAKLKGKDGNYPPSWKDLLEVFPEIDDTESFLGKNAFFQEDCYSWEASYDETLDPPIKFLITVRPPKGHKIERIRRLSKITLDQNNVAKEYKGHKVEHIQQLSKITEIERIRRLSKITVDYNNVSKEYEATSE